MNHRLWTPVVPGLVLIVAIVAAACGGPSPSSGPPPSPDWPQANHDLANTRQAAGSTISAANVQALGVDWSFKVSGSGDFGVLATSPIVIGQTVYLQDLNSNVYAIDLATGVMQWEKQYNAPDLGPNGVGYENGTLYATSDAHTVVAINATTGAELWSRTVAPPMQQITQQLTVHAGVVYVSTVDFEKREPQDGTGTGTIHALNAQTGDDIWAFDTIKDGYLWGNPTINSGGGAWYPPALDTANGTTFWGTNNAAPWPGIPGYPNGSSRPGPDLYTDSEIALNRSGNLQWYNQPQQFDIFDHDFTVSPILTTANAGGSSRKVVIGAGKGGYVVAFDRKTGQTVWRTAVGVHHNDNLTAIPAGQTATVEPGSFGGVETPMALADGVVYVPVLNLPTDYTGTTRTNRDLSTGRGELDAVDVNTGRVLWTSALASEDFGSVVVVNDLVFTATFTGQVLAFNRTSGKQVWSYQAPGGINGFLAVSADRVLVPVGLGASPALIALRLGPASTASATPAASGPASSCAASAVALCIGTSNQGNGISFDTHDLPVAAGAHVTLTYTNNSSIPHNVHLFNGPDASSPSIGSTPIKAGPNAVEAFTFIAPSQPGRYFFQCDVHPTLMTGYLDVH